MQSGKGCVVESEVLKYHFESLCALFPVEAEPVHIVEVDAQNCVELSACWGVEEIAMVGCRRAENAV